MVYKLKYGWCLRDSKSRKNYSTIKEISKNILKSLLISQKYDLLYRLYYTKMYHVFKKSSAISIYRTSCSFSNQGRVIFRQSKLSRLFCKYFAPNGFLLGMRKSSF